MPIDDASLPLGAYETPVTKRILERLAATEAEHGFQRPALEDATDQHRERYTDAITRVLADHLTQKLLNTREPLQRVELINTLAELIDPDDAIESETLLHAVYEASLGEPPRFQPTSLTGASLLTNASSDLSMAAEIKREIRTADSVDLLCAFIKNSGIAVIRDQLEYLRDNNIPLRVITSTYCGASDIEAINRLVEEFGAEVKVGYESRDTRLHAKAWLFSRNSGFDTAYIGSSNLSNSALIDGVEWNVRASRTSTPEILRKFEAVFETYWNDKHYATYEPKADHDRLFEALKRERFGTTPSDRIELSGLEVQPWPYQQAMLEALEAERDVHDRHRNLLIAATGTGKTVVAALDYKGLAAASKSKPSLLFVAHQRELLRQAMRTYREVLRDNNFGELFDGTHTPRQGTHIFATIQTLHKHVESFPPEKFDVVAIDEFHHAEASTYKKGARLPQAEGTPRSYRHTRARRRRQRPAFLRLSRRLRTASLGCTATRPRGTNALLRHQRRDGPPKREMVALKPRLRHRFTERVLRSAWRFPRKTHPQRTPKTCVRPRGAQGSRLLRQHRSRTIHGGTV
ncbi:DEAD/DEAH box helicase family protein [Corynebacterium sp. HMSC034E11]|uniref:DEAD/DEAH box helicase family protein n=1 Tax=Corynebacterium sp. HMSC034E11 TaxID=1715169 RepID=UPI000A6F6646|nr:DEAD/DEAH box helicase family protein [Corynebacterium sp. HMSC034E11]